MGQIQVMTPSNGPNMGRDPYKLAKSRLRPPEMAQIQTLILDMGQFRTRPPDMGEIQTRTPRNEPDLGQDP